MLLLITSSPADWPILDQGPLSASLGSARFTRSDGWLLDGDAILRTQSSAGRFSHSQQSISWSRTMTADVWRRP